MALIIFLLIVTATALFGAQFVPGEWYAALNKPAWTPPNWLFGPVWTAIYLMIAVAGWQVWRQGGQARIPAMTFWGLQIVLNGLWSWLFFGLHQTGLALVDIALLLAAIVGFVITARHTRLAAWLFVPYLLWVGYATALNFAIWQMN